MKQITDTIFKLETIEERSNFFDSLFVTEEFKTLISQNHHAIKMIKDNYIKYPRYYYHMKDKDLERAAFTSWYNVLSLKKYQNPYIQDLYYFHELTHISTMPYQPELNFSQWCTKMRNNEVLASMNSEVLIYFFMPNYRQHTFSEEIWADRFLNNSYYLKMAQDNPHQLAIELTTKRLEAYDNPQDKVEEILKDFRQFSFLYYNVWQDQYKEVEQVLKDFYLGDEFKYEEMLRFYQSPSGILFEDKVQEHHENYVSRNKLRPHY